MRLELGRRGDYAIRAMLALAAVDDPRPLSSRRIADRMDIPVRFLPHVLTDLVRAGLVIGVTGRSGGYVLSRPAGAISLLDILDAIAEETEPARCVLRGGPCDVEGRCAVHGPMTSATNAMRRELASASLAEVARRGSLHLAVAN